MASLRLPDMSDALVPQTSSQPVNAFEAQTMYQSNMFHMQPTLEPSGQLYPPFPGVGLHPSQYPVSLPPQPIPHHFDPAPEAPQLQAPVAAPPQSTRTAAEARQRKVAQRRSVPPKRKAPASKGQSDNEDSTEDDTDDEDGRDKTGDYAEVPRMDIPVETSSAAEIAKSKYNDVKDEKERKRLKRLLRNRVSAQQARERKKAYLGEMETRTKQIEDRNAELEQRVNTLERENFMLRQILKNTTQNKGPQPGK